jgi:hypothetical protein
VRDDARIAAEWRASALPDPEPYEAPVSSGAPKRPLLSLTCRACGEPFMASDKRRLYCCRTCKEAVWCLAQMKAPPVCELCGNRAVGAACDRCDLGLRRGDAKATPHKPAPKKEPTPRIRDEESIGFEPGTCARCGQEDVFDIALHRCEAALRAS